MKEGSKQSLMGLLNDLDDPWEEENQLPKKEEQEARYTYIKHIASGGQKNISSAFDTKLHRTVALAELKSDLPDQETESFIEEIFLTASFQHPNIIKILDFGIRKEDTLFFTMELMLNSNLRNHIKKNETPATQNLEIFLKICDAIAYAHSKGVIHLDLKPDNIQIGAFGEVLISDWGLSKKLGSGLKNSKSQGTPGFMAPEQTASGAELSSATDIYSLGAILSFLFSKVPENEIPQGIHAVIKKAMAQDPEERYQKVEDLKHEISNFIAGYSTNAQQAGFIKELQLLIRRNSQLCITIFTSLILITCLTAYFLLNLKDKNVNLAQSIEELEITGRKLSKSVILEKQLNTELVNRELKVAENLMQYPLYFSSPASSSQKALDIYLRQENTQTFNKKLLIILLIRQDFDKILELELKAPEELMEIIEKFAQKPKSADGVLKELKDFVELLQTMNNLPNKPFSNLKKAYMERAVYYSDDVVKPIIMSPLIIKQLIKTWNPDWDTNNLFYSIHNSSLTLRGHELSVLSDNSPYSSHYSFLRFLKFKKLDLRESNIAVMRHLNGLDLQTLDIRETQVQNLHPHKATRDISTVIINPGQFPEESINHLPPAVKIIQRK
ncbi:hypothetical protein LNTAR_09639 [Lentisphaera araneosa HTCC2155]|uniref:Protein kinase domain-containing protein n=2 Tax=Lentisphaera TaxID=256846 RepID=A6DIG9_9BACT|nr:hypothetical protein LNTAR_09639 [Lentisphaera araneosa HTCC2155]